MELRAEYNKVSLDTITTWARLVLPGDDLPIISSALNQYAFMPHHLKKQELDLCIKNAVGMASFYFDKDLPINKQKRKSEMRRNLFKKSAEVDDGTLFFIKYGSNFYGYIRVLPVTNEQWSDYFDKGLIFESEFTACPRDFLARGEARTYTTDLGFLNAAIIHLKAWFKLGIEGR